MTGGINRRVESAHPSQCVDALDVIEDTGDLRRRDAFMSVATADAHDMPAGVTYAVADTTLWTQRAGNLSGVAALFVGVAPPVGLTASLDQFDGVSFQHNSTPPTLSAHRYIDVSYWNGASWVVMPWWWDDTVYFDGSYTQSISKDGRIAWHTADFASLWATYAEPVSGVTGYWVRIRALDVQGVPSTLAASATFFNAPGLKAFQLAPVNGLFPVQIENRSTAIICADRENKRGLEHGASIGARDEQSFFTRRLYLVLEEQAGHYGTIQFPYWQRNGVDTADGHGTVAALDCLRKTRTEYYDDALKIMRPFDWLDGQFVGATLLYNMAPASLLAGSFDISGALAGSTGEVSRRFEHGRLFVRTGGGGATAGNIREITGFNPATGLLYWYRAFGSAPNGSARFDLRGPPLKVLLDPTPDQYGFTPNIFEIDTNTADTITLLAGTSFSFPSLSSLAGWSGMMHIVQEPRFAIDSGMRYTGSVDPITGLLLLTNGGAPLTTDGRTLRLLKADFDSDAALIYAGQLADVQAVSIETDPKAIARGQLRIAPPAAAFVTIFRGIVFLAGIPGEPLRVVWSAPGFISMFWPLINEGIVRDAEQQPITGMAVISDRLVIFTGSAIHEARGPDDHGLFSFNPIAQGIGFVHQNAVASITGVETNLLAGVTRDGIYVYDGSDPRQVLREWTDLLAEGVNQSRLNRSIAVAFPEKNWILFAVPTGGSQKNDRIVVWDYIADKWWVWSARWGVSSMAVDRDSAGRSQLLIGTDDGFVQSLVAGDTDDGQSIDAYAFSPPIAPKHGVRVSPVRVVMTAKDIGRERTMSVGLVLEDDFDDRSAEGDLYVDAGGLFWDPASEDWSSSALVGPEQRWHGRKFLTVEAGFPTGLVAHRVGLRIGGTSQWTFRGASLIFVPKAERAIR